AMAARLAVQRVTPSATALAPATAVRDKHAAELLAYPEVQAVGLGASYDNPSEAAILLFVMKGQSRSNLRSSSRNTDSFPRKRVLRSNSPRRRRSLFILFRIWKSPARKWRMRRT